LNEAGVAVLARQSIHFARACHEGASTSASPDAASKTAIGAGVARIG